MTVLPEDLGPPLSKHFPYVSRNGSHICCTVATVIFVAKFSFQNKVRPLLEHHYY